MLRMVKRLIALSLGTQRAQLEQRTGRTWPRPLLLRPLVKTSAILLERISCTSPNRPCSRAIRADTLRRRRASSTADQARDGWRWMGLAYLFALFLTIVTDFSATGGQKRKGVGGEEARTWLSGWVVEGSLAMDGGSCVQQLWAALMTKHALSEGHALLPEADTVR